MRTEEPDGHGDTLAHESGEVGHARANGVAARTGADTCGGIKEIEHKLYRQRKLISTSHGREERRTSSSVNKLTMATSLAAVFNAATSDAASALTAAMVLRARVKRRAVGKEGIAAVVNETKKL